MGKCFGCFAVKTPDLILRHLGPETDQLIYADVKVCSETGQKCEVRKTLASLPFGDRRFGHPHKLCKLLLCYPFFSPFFRNRVCKSDLSHSSHLLDLLYRLTKSTVKGAVVNFSAENQLSGNFCTHSVHRVENQIKKDCHLTALFRFRKYLKM